MKCVKAMVDETKKRTRMCTKVQVASRNVDGFNSTFLADCFSIG